MGAMTERIPAGWYPDQSVPGYRYWDGARWTEHSVVAVEGGLEGMPAPPLAQGQPGGQNQQVGVQYQQVGIQYQQPAQYPQPVLAPPIGPADEEPVSPGAQLAVAILSIIAAVAALVVATTVPHSAGETLISNAYYMKESYYTFMLIAAGELILFGIALLLLLMAGVDAIWVKRLTAAAALLSALILIFAATVYVSYATADDNGTTTAPRTTAPPRDSTDLLK